jgi:hypothetical protein
MDTFATIVTAVAAVVVSYLLQKPYVRVVKMFANGQASYTTYKLKNAGAGTASCIVLQDRYGNPIDLDVKLGQLVKYVDALSPGADITVGVLDSSVPVKVHYENIFGLLFHTELGEGGNRFRMVGRKTWRFVHTVPPAVRSEFPHHWWRR